jgi:hypothetical protein
VTPHSRGAIARGSCFGITPEKQEGAGKRERKTHPQPRVHSESTRVSNHRYAATSGLPCAMVYGLFRALPGVRDLIVTVAHKTSLAHLAPAQGCQDHTASPSAIDIVRRAKPIASTTSRPTFVTCARPSCRGGTAAMDHHFPKNGSKIFFVPGLDRTNQVESAHEFRFFAQGILCLRGPRERAAIAKIAPISLVGQISWATTPFRCKRFRIAFPSMQAAHPVHRLASRARDVDR